MVKSRDFLVCQIPALSVVLQRENVPAELRRLPESSHLACAVGFDSHSAHSAGVLSMGLDALGISACVWLGFWPSFFLVFFCALPFD